jgi:hypothetical protein
LAIAGVVAVAAIALAAPSSTVPGFSFVPNNPHGVFKPGKLAVHTLTSYTNPGNSQPGGATQRIQLNLDDDFQLNPGSLPKCDPGQFSASTTMAQAMAKCGPPAGSAKNAWLWANLDTSNGSVQFVCPPGSCAPPPNPITVKGGVLAFNAQGSASEVLLFMRLDFFPPYPSNISCANPASSTAGDQTAIANGDLKANPAIGADYADPDQCSAPDPRQGCQIDINSITGSAAIPLSDLNFGLKRGNYVRARCIDPPAGNRKWNLRALFTYNGGSPLTTTVFKSQTCT